MKYILNMPYMQIAQQLETLNEDLLEEALNFISYLQTKQEKKSFSDRKFGTLEGKISAKFSENWEISDEEFLGV